MVPDQGLTSMIISMACILSVTTGVDGSRRSCPSAAVVDLTGWTPVTSGPINKSGEVYPPGSTWLENGTIFGCPCDFKMCVPLCCPVGYAGGPDGCIMDNFTSKKLPNDYERTTKNRHVFVNGPCSLSWSSDMLQQDNYILSRREASRYLINRLRTLGWRDFCILRKANSSKYFFASCTVSKWTSVRISFVICTSVSMLFAIATFVVYTVTPELRNLPGCIFRCYLATYIGCTFTLSTTVNFLLTNNFSSQIRTVYMLVVALLCYFGVACMLWLNVMSFDIWKTFRKIRSRPEANIKECQKGKFVRYSIYAWGGSALYVFLIISGVCVWNPIGSSDSTWQSVAGCFTILPIVGIAICNTCLYISTALTIKQRRKEIQHLENGMNTHHQENEKRFNLYVKLFVIMGGPLMLWAVAFYWDNYLFYIFVLILDLMQGISIFLIFVWKDDVKRSLRKRLVDVSATLRVYFQRST